MVFGPFPPPLCSRAKASPAEVALPQPPAIGRGHLIGRGHACCASLQPLLPRELQLSGGTLSFSSPGEGTSQVALRPSDFYPTIGHFPGVCTPGALVTRADQGAAEGPGASVWPCSSAPAVPGSGETVLGSPGHLQDAHPSSFPAHFLAFSHPGNHCCTKL